MRAFLGIFLFTLFLNNRPACGQVSPIAHPKPAPVKSIPLQVPGTILDGDTVAMFDLACVNIFSPRKFKSFEEANKYYRLVYNIKTVYPYAILVEANYKQCEETIAIMPEGESKRKYLKDAEKQLDEQYKKDIESLSEEQGRLLIKLIDKETGVTPYAMIKELKGSLTAFMWQTVGNLYHNNLKDTYDPDTDADIDNILQLIEMGAI